MMKPGWIDGEIGGIDGETGLDLQTKRGGINSKMGSKIQGMWIVDFQGFPDGFNCSLKKARYSIKSFLLYTSL